MKILATLPLLLTALAAQDPPPPPAGFPILELLAQDLTYSDGYRTRYDLRMPDPAQVPPPTTGWPFLLLVHGFPGGRGEFVITGEGRVFAQRGYITLAYDVRGQGQARVLNPGRGTTFSGRLEKGDMAELFHHAETRLGVQMDFNRLAVYGTSQGGDHSWAAAAWSEQQMPQARGAIQSFPKITAVCPRAGSPDLTALWVPDDNAFAGNFARNWFNTGATIDPTLRAQLQQLFLAQDFAGLTTLLRTDPWRQDPILARASKVPVFQQSSWDDFVFGENSAVDAVNALPASTDRLVYLSTGFHKSPLNNLETAYGDDLTKRWLDNIVKGYADEITQQPSFLLASVPPDPTAASSPTSIWQLRQTASYPATGLTTTQTLYLRQGNVLSSLPPTSSEPTDRITHTVPTSFDPNAWVQTANVAAQVFAAVPLSAVAYRGAPLAADLELLGRVQARIQVTSVAADLQIGVALLDEDPTGNQRYVTGGHACVRGRTPGDSSHDLTMRGAAYVFPAGHRLVISVENHVWHRPLGISELRTVPYFASYTFDCRHNATAVSFVQLPTTAPRLGTRASTLTLRQQVAGSVPLVLAGGPDRAGHVYAALVSLSGTTPGFPFLGEVVPINFDGLTQLGLSVPNGSLFQGFVGTLDQNGAATASFATAAGQVPASLVGMRLSFAGVTFAASGAFSVSAPSQVLIVP